MRYTVRNGRTVQEWKDVPSHVRFFICNTLRMYVRKKAWQVQKNIVEL